MESSIELEGKKVAVIKLPLGNAQFIVLKATKGYVACGYLNLEMAEKLGDCACVVTGVKNEQDVLSAQVKACTSCARKLGISEGMGGKEALKKML